MIKSPNDHEKRENKLAEVRRGATRLIADLRLN